MSSIRTLKSFLAVSRLGSFSAAGKEIGLTAAAVGQQIRALEDELCKVLFDRSGRAIVLNTAGREMIAPVKELVARYEALATRDRGAQLAGTVVMGALVSALMGAFADSLWSLTRQHPELDVTLLAGQSADFALKVVRSTSRRIQPPGRCSASPTFAIDCRRPSRSTWNRRTARSPRSRNW